MPDNIIPLYRGHVRPIPHEDKARATLDPGAIYRRPDGPEGVAVHERIGEPTLLDDVRELWADIAAEPSSHIVVGLLGFAAGCFGTVGLAWVYAQVAL